MDVKKGKSLWFYFIRFAQLGYIIEKENKIWRWALKKTAENDKKNKKIHIKL